MTIKKPGWEPGFLFRESCLHRVLLCSTQEHIMAKHQQPSAIHIQKFLSGLDYPADKQDLIDRAEENGADMQTVAALEKIPEREYENPVEVSREVSKLH
jgi:hypothetical protein